MLIGAITGLSLILSAVLWVSQGGTLGELWLLLPGFLGSFLLLSLLTFLLVLAACAAVHTDVPQEKDSPFYRRLTCLLAEAALTILSVRMHTEGLEKLPKSGRFLLVCNHLSDMDPVVLMHYFGKRQVAFISKRENTTMFVVGKLMHKTMCQLINRENDREALKTILKCVQLLKEDQVSIGVFPEGYTSMDHKFHPFRSGVFKIALRAKVPVVVCTLKNTQFVFDNAKRLKRTEVHLHLLDVIQPENFGTAVELGNEAHRLMAEDLGDEYAPLEQNG